MANKMRKRNKAQSTLEYLGVVSVFAAAGILTFIAGVVATRGTMYNYNTQRTLLGDALNNGVPDSEEGWPGSPPTP